MPKFELIKVLLWMLIGLLGANYALAQDEKGRLFFKTVEKEILDAMSQGDIPGISIIIINDGVQHIKSYGYADLELKKPIDQRTLFEIGSCSKAFTALAFTRFAQDYEIDLNTAVTAYIPWFRTTYNDSVAQITLEQLLHHTSGIPWSTISKIPQNNSSNALEQTIKTLIDLELDEPPGEKYEYATINYDILALVIQEVTHRTFETYLENKIIIPLGLTETTIGDPKNMDQMALGYKIGFLAPRRYTTPKFKGNNAAGYVISNSQDMGRWLRFQMGLIDHGLFDLAKITQIRDKTVPLHDMAAYGGGWNIALDGTGEIYHSGYNPTFSSYVVFRPDKKMGVVILSNSNSNYTVFLGNKLMKLLVDETIEREYLPGDGNDKSYTAVSLALTLYCLFALAFLSKIFVDIFKRKRRYSGLVRPKVGKLILAAAAMMPALGGIYLLPTAIGDFSWNALLIWSPQSFGFLIFMVLVAIIITYCLYCIRVFFSETNEYKRKYPEILVVAILSGLANVALVIMVTSVIGSDIEIRYLIGYYMLLAAIYLFGRRYVQVGLIKFARSLVYDLRIKLIHKIFSTSYAKFESIERGRVYTALNDDVSTVGQSANMMVTLITSVITAIGAFLYLSSIAFWATILTILLILSLSVLYYFAGKSTNKYFEAARDSRNVFMSLINGMIDGFKEISMHKNKKIEYEEDVGASAMEYKEKVSTADIKFANAFLIGESFLIVLLGLVAIGMYEIFPSIRIQTIMSFVIVLLYLIGPVNAILDAVPRLMNLRIAWNRVQGFLADIPANLDLDKIPAPTFKDIHSIRVKGAKFQFETFDGQENGFAIGPIDLNANKGEIVFIVGGNGSGKTTLAKILTGLYEPDEGIIMINNKEVSSSELSEYYSTVFSPPHLFKKLYNINLENNQQELQKYLRVLGLEEKVKITNNTYNTIKLSGGQRKRLALLQCFLEDHPIYMFDEWAADQDPEYRNFFYKTLLPEMKKKGKIVIAITHDDNYFSVADQILKMNQGRLERFAENDLRETIKS